MTFTFIIQFKYDSTDRLKNLLRCLIYLTHQFKDTAEYLVILQNNVLENGEKCSEYLQTIFTEYKLKNVTIHSCELYGPYHRSKIINNGLRLAKNNVCVIYDCDILLPKEQIDLSVELCDSKYQLVFPYTNPQYDIPQDYFKDFSYDYDFENLQYKIRPRQLQHNHQTEQYPVIGYATGFSMVVNKNSLGNLVFFNEEFNGWGYEDSEYIFKMRFFDVKMTRVYGQVFHIEHSRELQDMYKSYTEKNYLLYLQLKNKNRDELLDYYKQK